MDSAGGDSRQISDEKSSRSGYMYYLSLVVVLIGCTTVLLLMPYQGRRFYVMYACRDMIVY